MTDDNPGELPSVQLTRMEGILALIAYKVDSVVPRVDNHDQRIGALELSTQRLGDEAEARDATVAVTAKALREAKEAQDATANAERIQAETAWTPYARMATLAAALSSVVAIYYAFN